MSHTHSTTTTRSYKHLDPYRRGQIFALLSTGMSKTDIAKQVKISRATLYREIDYTRHCDTNAIRPYHIPKVLPGYGTKKL